MREKIIFVWGFEESWLLEFRDKIKHMAMKRLIFLAPLTVCKVKTSHGRKLKTCTGKKKKLKGPQNACFIVTLFLLPLETILQGYPLGKADSCLLYQLFTARQLINYLPLSHWTQLWRSSACVCVPWRWRRGEGLMGRACLSYSGYRRREVDVDPRRQGLKEKRWRWDVHTSHQRLVPSLLWERS